MELPIGFIKKIQQLLGEESESFFTHLKDESPIGIRVNPIKTNRNDFLAAVTANGTPITWCNDGFF